MADIKLSALAKYGTLLTCAMLALVAAIAWFIQYPETVTGRGKLAGANAPKPIISRQSARLQYLYKTNGDSVAKGDIIGCIETTADIKEVFRLARFVSQLHTLLQNDEPRLIRQLMDTSFSQLGELQGDYQTFMQAYIPYRDYVLGDYVTQRKNLLEKDLSIVRRSRSILNERRTLNREDLRLSHTTLEKNKRLLDEKLISEQEYRDLTSQDINKRMAEPQMKSESISNEAQVNGIRKELVELEKQVVTQKSLFQQAVFNLKSRIDDWKYNYLLIASESGRLAFTSFLQQNEIVEAGHVVGYIVPPRSEIYIEILVPQANFGKVQQGQDVLLKFDAYPWQEFGTVMGKVEYISPVPADSGYYLAKVTLPDKLKTNYRKEIPFVEGLIAQSEIITKDMRLAESFYYSLAKQWKK